VRRRAHPRERHEASRNLKDLELPLLIPGIKINTRPTDYYPLEQLQMMRFNGTQWERFGPVISGELSGS